MCYTFRQNLYLKKTIKICSSLTWRQSKKCKICAKITKTNILLQLFLRSSHASQNIFVIFVYTRNMLIIYSKYIPPQKQPSRYIFQYRCSVTTLKFFEKCLWWSAVFSNFHVTLSRFEPMLRKRYISTQH